MTRRDYLEAKKSIKKGKKAHKKLGNEIIAANTEYGKRLANEAENKALNKQIKKQKKLDKKLAKKNK